MEIEKETLVPWMMIKVWASLTGYWESKRLKGIYPKLF
jgi:hypothetical protein